MIPTDTLVFWLSVAASVASIISVPVAIVQTLKVRRLNIEKQRKTWTQISSTKALMRHLEAEKLDSSYGLVCEQFRDLLREAVLLERNFSVETIARWRKVGKLSSDWQEYQVTQLLRTSEIDDRAKISDMSTPLSDYDTTAPDHPVARAPVNPFRDHSAPQNDRGIDK